MVTTLSPEEETFWQNHERYTATDAKGLKPALRSFLRNCSDSLLLQRLGDPDESNPIAWEALHCTKIPDRNPGEWIEISEGDILILKRNSLGEIEKEITITRFPKRIKSEPSMMFLLHAKAKRTFLPLYNLEVIKGKLEMKLEEFQKQLNGYVGSVRDTAYHAHT